ncbi:MAG: tRNA uridine-5-carboxymethylaminomethyl(34) synthesis GTPase MnmE [Halioglobus sp.]|nr:tRNA uridine-5-carboxymethylaminomethyl(34) synthesis GTPase MnmE [Halioglobus sp.]
MTTDTATIAALATPVGQGGIGVIRLSGDAALAIGKALTGINLQPRHAHYCHFHSPQGEILDSGLALFFPGPKSFTGEDVVELQGHGGPVILDMILKACCSHGARQAKPGEFSERAFLNNKLDLTQAEAIADLIASSSERAAINASRTLRGEFSRKIDSLTAAVTELRAYIEAAIDFPEEEIDFLSDGRVAEMLDNVKSLFTAIRSEARQGSLISEGMKLVIAGRPNAGKSSLLNALSGEDSAIVTAIAGTTRDVLREQIQIDGMPLHIVDTAGLRDSDDVIEQEGIRRAIREMASADRILLVVDSHESSPDESGPLEWPTEMRHPELQGIPVTVVRNKCDLSQQPPSIDTQGQATMITLSAKTGDGVSLLKQHLKQCMGYHTSAEGAFSARRRHLKALELAENHLLRGAEQLSQTGAGELLAEDLRQCQQSLGEITGVVSSDDLLGEIFSSFCIGK